MKPTKTATAFYETARPMGKSNMLSGGLFRQADS